MSNIIPIPAEIEEQPDSFFLEPETVILSDSENRWNAEYLHDLLAAPTGFPFQIMIGGHEEPAGCIFLRLNPEAEPLGDEGYRLEASPESVTIEAATSKGIFYGIQTLRQLLPVEIESRQPVPGMDWCIPSVSIVDRPRFTWRGFMLDEGRHFLGKETVLQMLDLMALQKLNILHWHLTEDQGWRIEIRKYPRLAEIGSKRPGTSRTFLGEHDGIPHAGYYSQEDIRTIVAYALQRNITIVPEIEIPGHCTAALAAYLEFSCTGGPFEVATHFGIFPDIYCAGKEKTFTFLQDVLDEIMELFPSPYIHIGGDEAPKKRWKKCPNCQERMRAEGLRSEHELQVYFTNRILKYLASKGRKGMGWNEILGPELADDALVQYWLGSRKELIAEIKAHSRKVIMSSFLDAYLDHAYSLTPLSRAYQYEPIPSQVDNTSASSILGVEFPLWTEWVPNRARLDYQVHPRLSAMAETAWSPQKAKDLADFRRRLGNLLKRLDLLGVKYAPMDEVEPAWFRRLFGLFRLAQPQRKIAG
jgi:hexosaminidase